MINEAIVYKKTQEFVFRNIGGELILVPVRNDVVNLNNLYTLNAVAGRIFQLCDGSSSLNEIILMILNEFDVSREELIHDVDELVASFLKINAIEKV